MQRIVAGSYKRRDIVQKCILCFGLCKKQHIDQTNILSEIRHESTNLNSEQLLVTYLKGVIMDNTPYFDEQGGDALESKTKNDAMKDPWLYFHSRSACLPVPLGQQTGEYVQAGTQNGYEPLRNV